MTDAAVPPAAPGRIPPALLVGVDGAAAAVLIGAWWGASGSVNLAGQVAWLEVGIAALLLSGVANLAYLVAQRRDVARRRAGGRSRIERITGQFVAPPFSAADEADNVLVATEGTRMFHRAACSMVHGRSTTVATRAGHTSDGRHPCGICRP